MPTKTPTKAATSATTPSIKQHNRSAITRLLATTGAASKQDIAQQLGLSLPTVTQNLRELMENGIITEGELQESTGGRKARAYAFNAQHHTAIGVAMHATDVVLYAPDLNGDIIAHRRRTMQCRNDNAYYQRLSGLINAFASELTNKGHAVSAVAFAVDGIVTADGSAVIDLDSAATSQAASQATKQTTQQVTRKLSAIAQSVRLPAMLISSAQASATVELWHDRTLQDAICIYLDRRPAAAIIINGALHPGATRSNGLIGHMTLVPNGRPCFCGRLGCMDAYCSPEVLMEDGESLPGFFSVLEQGELHHRERMDEWMQYLGQAIANMRTVIGGDVIIGGEAAQFLDDADLATLQARIAEHCIFSRVFDSDVVVRLGRCDDDQNAIGAALHCLDDYMRRLCDM